MNYEFHPEALAEYEAAIAYYAEHDPGVARHEKSGSNGLRKEGAKLEDL